jgi:hypothetical protein
MHRPKRLVTISNISLTSKADRASDGWKVVWEWLGAPAAHVRLIWNGGLELVQSKQLALLLQSFPWVNCCLTTMCFFALRMWSSSKMGNGSMIRPVLGRLKSGSLFM